MWLIIGGLSLVVFFSFVTAFIEGLWNQHQEEKRQKEREAEYDEFRKSAK